MKFLPVLTAIATFAVCSLPIARAEASSEPRAATVRFADLDTTSAQGAAVLYRRIKSAAKIVCQDLEPGRQLALISLYTNCVNKAIGNAVAKLDFPAVTEYAVARGVLPPNTAIKIARNE